MIGLNAMMLFTGSGYRNAGVSRYTQEIVSRLVQTNHDYVLFLNGDAQELPFDIGSNCIVHRGFKGADNPWKRIAWEQTVLPVLARRSGLDILHSFLNVSPILDGTAQVLTVHDLSYVMVREAHPLRRRMYLPVMSRLSIHRASRIFADSNATRTDIADHYGTNPKKIDVVYPGVDKGMSPQPEHLIESFRSDKGLPNNFILYLGTIERRKNVDILVRAFAQLRRTDRYKGHLVVAGGRGWDYDEVDRAVREEGVESEVIFVGFVAESDKAMWYNAARVLVYPSSYEGFGLPVLEAMACGTPVVTSNVSSMPEVAGKAAVTVSPGNPCDLADAIFSITDSPERAQKMRSLGIEQSSRFSWDKAAEKCLLAYEGIIES